MVNRIRSVIEDSNLFVALGVWSLVKLTGVLHSVDVDNFSIFSFFSTLLVYSFSILFSSGRLNGFKSLLSIDKLLVQKTVFFISALVLPFFLLKFSVELMLMLIPLGVVSFLYPVEIISEKKKGIALREFPYVKIFLIGVSWGIVTVVLPLFESGADVNLSVLTEAIVRAMFVVAITIPFDVRDVYSDSPEMKTIPQRLGVVKAKILAYFLLLINFAYYVFMGQLGLNSLLLILITLFVTSILVRYSDSDKPHYYYSVFMESTSVMLFFSIYI